MKTYNKIKFFYKKHITYLFFLMSMSCYQSSAAETVPSNMDTANGAQIQIEEWESKRSSIQMVHEYMNDLLIQQHVAPEEILLVLDVDGTLTTYSDPQKIPKELNGKVRSRGKACEFVQEMVQKGVKVVVSSAWKKSIENSDDLDGLGGFCETLGRLRDIGLGTVLGIEEGEEGKIVHISGGHKNISCDNPEYCHLGLVASVSHADDYYRQKAYAFKYVYPDLDLKMITHVIFADDSRQNINLFLQDIQKVGLGTTCQVTLQVFWLSQIAGGDDSPLTGSGSKRKVDNASQRQQGGDVPNQGSDSKRQKRDVTQ